MALALGELYIRTLCSISQWEHHTQEGGITWQHRKLERDWDWGESVSRTKWDSMRLLTSF